MNRADVQPSWERFDPTYDAHKNAMSTPVPAPDVPMDILRMQVQDAGNDALWRCEPTIDTWLTNARLGGLSALMHRAAREVPPESLAWLERYRLARSLAWRRWPACSRQAHRPRPKHLPGSGRPSP